MELTGTSLYLSLSCTPFLCCHFTLWISALTLSSVSCAFPLSNSPVTLPSCMPFPCNRHHFSLTLFSHCCRRSSTAVERTRGEPAIRVVSGVSVLPDHVPGAAAAPRQIPGDLHPRRQQDNRKCPSQPLFVSPSSFPLLQYCAVQPYLSSQIIITLRPFLSLF